MDGVTTVFALCRDYGLTSDTAHALRDRASAEAMAFGPGGLVLLAWPAPAGDTRYKVINPKGASREVLAR